MQSAVYSTNRRNIPITDHTVKLVWRYFALQLQPSDMNIPGNFSLDFHSERKSVLKPRFSQLKIISPLIVNKLNHNVCVL